MSFESIRFFYLAKGKVVIAGLKYIASYSDVSLKLISIFICFIVRVLCNVLRSKTQKITAHIVINKSN
jgi:hypothetical protein